MKLKHLGVSLLLLAVAAFAAAETPTASSVIADAQRVAKAEHKGVIVMFHASWCKWCKRLEKVMSEPGVKSIFDENYVIAMLTVQERGDKKALENPGGDDLMKEYGGQDSGLPYYVVLNSDSKAIADSKVAGVDKAGKPTPPENMGYPTETKEIQHFLDMLKAANPAVTDTKLQPLKEALIAEAKLINGH